MINAGLLNCDTNERERIEKSIADFIHSEESNDIEEQLRRDDSAASKFFSGIYSHIELEEKNLSETEVKSMKPEELGFDRFAL